MDAEEFKDALDDICNRVCDNQHGRSQAIAALHPEVDRLYSGIQEAEKNLEEMRSALALVMDDPMPDDMLAMGMPFNFVRQIDDNNEAKSAASKMAILAVDSASRVLLSEMHSHPPDKQNFVTVAITFNREFYNLTLQRAVGKTPATVIAERNEEIENLRARLAEADSALLEADVLLEEFRDPSRAVRLYTERRAALKGRGA